MELNKARGKAASKFVVQFTEMIFKAGSLYSNESPMKIKIRRVKKETGLREFRRCASVASQMFSRVNESPVNLRLVRPV